MLDRIDACTTSEAMLNERIDAQVRPFRRPTELLATIPGVSLHTAETILAKAGADMGRFSTAGQLAAWAGVCPGNHESAGRQPTGRTRHRDPWLKAVLGQAAVSAARTNNTYLAARYRRIAARRGKKHALVAVEHSLLIAIWHMLTHNMAYTDLGGDYFLHHTGRARHTRPLVNQLNQLGYQLTLQPVQAA